MMISRKMRFAVGIAYTGEKRNACRIVVVKLKGKRPLGRPGLRRENNITINLGEIGRDGMD
jgi:hypothetical protein